MEAWDKERGDIPLPNGEVGEIPTRTRHGKRSNTPITMPLARRAGKAIGVTAASPETYPRQRSTLASGMAMGSSIKTHLIIFSFAVSMPGSLHAQYGETAEVDRPLAATNPEDPTASGTSIDLMRRPEANETAQDVLPEIPGANVIALGGPFDFTSLSLRGVEAENTTVLLGNLPLSNRDTGAFDFSLIPISAFGRIEVYRGGAPAWFNNGSIGGVVRLIPRENPTTGVGGNFGVASFGTYRAEVEGSVNKNKVRSFNDLRYSRTKGDFPFRHDNCTPFVPEDDFDTTRLNNEKQLVQGLSFTRVGTKRGEVDVVLLATHHEGGVPGPACGAALQTHQARTQVFGGVSYTQEGTHRGGKRYELQAILGGGYARNQVDDPFGEIGLGGPFRSDDRLANLYGRLGTRLEVSDHVDWTILGTAQLDYYDPKVDTLTLEPSRRTEGALVMEPRIYGKSGNTLMELRSSVRFGFSHTQVRTPQLGPEVDRDDRDFLPTLRLAGAIGPLPWLTIAASGYTGVRLPTILELFGTRARVRGNPTLNSERGLGADLSVVMKGKTGVLAGSAEIRGFVSSRDDIIVPRRSGPQLIFTNEAEARAWGLEARLAAEITRHLTIASTLTALFTENEQGNQLPLFSPFLTLSRVEGHTREIGDRVDDLVLYVQLYHRTGGYFDPANFVPFPSFTPLTLGAYALLFDERLWIVFTVRNVNDDRSFDVLSYPLPGRNYAFTISYRHRFTGH